MVFLFKIIEQEIGKQRFSKNYQGKKQVISGGNVFF